MILSETKITQYAALYGIDYSMIYMRHNNTIYGHNPDNYDNYYGRLFISLYTVYDFIDELRPIKDIKWLLK